MDLICDTNFYYNPCPRILSIPGLKIIGTFMNAWELISSNNYSNAKFHILQAAARNFITHPSSYLKSNPFAEVIDRKIPTQFILKEQYLWNHMYAILVDIVNSRSYQQFHNPLGANQFSQYDHAQRAYAANYFNDYFTSFRKRYKQHQIRVYMKDRKELDVQTKPIFFKIVSELIYRDYGRTISSSMIDWGNRSFLLDAFIDFNIAYLSGSRGASKTGVQINPNDLGDLFMISYVDRVSFYHTMDGFWRNMCLSNPVLNARFIDC